MNTDNNKILSRLIEYIAIFCLLGSEQLFAFGIGISPTTVEMVVEPGSQHRQTITVQNVHKSKTLALTVGIADWTLTKKGALELLPPESIEQSAADWVRFSPAFFSLKPGQSRQVQVDISVPVKLDKAGERKLGVLISTMLPKKNKHPDTSGVWNRFQVASLFYIALPGAEEKALVINSVSLIDKASIIPIIEYTVENPGDYHARLKGHLALKNQQGKQVFEIPIEEVLIAKQTRNFKLPIKLDNSKLPAGEYQVDLELRDTFSLDEKAVNKKAIIKTKLPTITVTHPVVSLK